MTILSYFFAQVVFSVLYVWTYIETDSIYFFYNLDVTIICNVAFVYINVSVGLMLLGTLFFSCSKSFQDNLVRVLCGLIYLLILNTDLKQNFDLGLVPSAICACSLMTFYELSRPNLSIRTLSMYLLSIGFFEFYFTGCIHYLVNIIPIIGGPNGHLYLSIGVLIIYPVLLVYVLRKIKANIASKGIIKTFYGLKFTKIQAFFRLIKEKRKKQQQNILLLYIETAMFTQMVMLTGSFYLALPFYSIFIVYSAYTYGIVGFWLFFIYVSTITLCVKNIQFQNHCKQNYSSVFFKLCLWNIVGNLCQKCAILVSSVAVVGAATDSASTYYNNNKHDAHVTNTQDRHEIWRKNLKIMGSKGAGPEPRILPRTDPQFNTHLVTHGVNAITEASKGLPAGETWQNPKKK